MRPGGCAADELRRSVVPPIDLRADTLALPDPPTQGPNGPPATGRPAVTLGVDGQDRVRGDGLLDADSVIRPARRNGYRRATLRVKAAADNRQGRTHAAAQGRDGVGAHALVRERFEVVLERVEDGGPVGPEEGVELGDLVEGDPVEQQAPFGGADLYERGAPEVAVRIGPLIAVACRNRLTDTGRGTFSSACCCVSRSFRSMAVVIP